MIAYSTPEKQIEKLKSQGLIIENETLAKQYLEFYGYSNLIKSYRSPYMTGIDETGTKCYKQGVTFNQILSLYTLDKNLRNAVMAAMQDLEEHIKAVAADIVAFSFGTHQDDYLRYKNYRNKRKRKQRFSLTHLLNIMEETLKTDKDPIHHYMQEHGAVPPWILFKSVYFGTIVNFIDQFKDSERSAMAHKLFDDSIFLHLDDTHSMKLMMNILFMANEYRNVAAHGGRIYNYECKSKLRIDEIFVNAHDDAEEKLSGFIQLLFLLHSLKYKAPFERLNTTLGNEVNRHCKQYPQDLDYLRKVTNAPLKAKHFVYFSGSSNIFHFDQHCSGMKDAQKIELAEAFDKGFSPCKRCAKVNK